MEDGEGVYTGVDIQNSIDAGYKVEFIGKCLVWDKSADVFGSYFEDFYKLKEESERASNKAMHLSPYTHFHQNIDAI